MMSAGAVVATHLGGHHGFAYYHAPIAVQQAAYAALCLHAAAGRIHIDIESLPLGDIRQAWDRQLAGSRTRLVLTPR